MRTYLALFLLLLMACKKDKAPTPQQLITGNTWSGRFVNPEAHEEPFTITFSADGQFLLKEQRAKYSGAWALEGQRLTATFALPGNTFTADVSTDGKLSNITCTLFDVKSCYINKEHSLPLENTTWKGVVGNATLELAFKPGNDVVVTKQFAYNGAGPSQAYLREYGTVSFDIVYDLNGAIDYFFFVREGNTITGVLYVDDFFNGIKKRQYWTATKQ